MSAPVASRERIAEVLREHQEDSVVDCICGWRERDHDVDLASHQRDALLAAGVFRDEATVKAEALEPFRKYFSNGGPDTPIRTAWDDGVECWSAPASDLRDLLAGASA